MAPRRHNPFLIPAAFNRDGSIVPTRINADDRIVFRSLQLDERMINKERRTAEFTFSSDIELERWRGVIEVLSHAPGAVDMSRLTAGAPLLFNHDMDDYVGVVESATIGADRKGRCVVRFSENDDAEKVWRDVQAGILRNVSVGYRIHEVKLTEEREGVDVYMVTRWEPYEISIVTVPADISVGIGRSVRSMFEKQTSSNKRSIMNRAQIIAMLRQLNVSFQDTATDDELSALLQRSLPANPPVNNPTPTPAPVQRMQVVTEDPATARRDGESGERDRVRQLFAMGRQYEAVELAEEAVEKGHTVDQFRAALIDHVDKRNKSVVEGTKPIGMTDKEARGFSFVKLFRYLSAEPDQKQKLMEGCRFEVEACNAAADQLTHRSAKGTVIPTDVLLMPLKGQRADTIVGAKTASGYTNAGTNSIETILLTNSFIDLLRNRSFLMRVVTELSGLVGNIDIPKQLTGPAASWIGEDTAAESTGVTFGLVSLRPKTLSARGELTRKLLMQNSLGVEALFRRDLATVMALEIDRAGIYGTNADNQPKGLINQSGINTDMWAADDAPTFAELVAMETEIAADNADIGSMAYAFNARMRGHFKTALKFDGIAGTIWEPGNTVNGYGTEVSNVLATGDVLFGNWADLLLGMWGGMDVVVDPYTHSDKGRIRITQFQDVDFTIRRGESFSYFKTAV